MCMRSSRLCFDASAIPRCTETWRTNKGFTKEVILGIVLIQIKALLKGHFRDSSFTNKGFPY